LISGYPFAVALPLLILLLAGLAAGFLGYGIHPALAQYPHGLEIILAARRYQLPVAALVVILCVSLIALVISGKQRAWWLVGLGPIVALLAHRFAGDPNSVFLVNTQPSFVFAEQARFVGDDDWVVGIQEDGEATAYPYAALYPAPLVVQMGRLSPMVLMWSPFANRALAVHVDRSIKSDEMQVVSMPANTLLVYNSRIGQFINGVTGLTNKGAKPDGFGQEIGTIKTTWKEWRTMHPDTKVLVPPIFEDGAPTRPVLPIFPMPPVGDSADSSGTVALFDGATPFAVRDDEILSTPTNFASDSQSVLLLRDRRSGLLRAWDRQVDTDLYPTFHAHKFTKFPDATMIDSDSNSPWTADGRALDGPLKGKKLKTVAVDDQVYLRVLRVWWPRLRVVEGK
jgi:hypothetical protein